MSDVRVLNPLRIVMTAVLCAVLLPGSTRAQTPPARPVPTAPAPTPAGQAAAAPTVTPTQPPVSRGRVTGRVVDAASGQSVADVTIQIVGTTFGARTDLDGRYTMLNVPFGTYSILARRLGYQPKQFDRVAVSTTDATIVNFTIGTAAVSLQGVVVRAAAGDRTASEASLLAAQQKAPAASDGVSAEQIKKTPDSNAGEAATRVSGVSIVDGKFLVARGLSERYSTTLLNGAEVPSPEPTKKLVPLDVFPASLLESIVVTKSATPDKPGDFSGGAVEIKTKEFPENPIRQISFSQGYNSQTTGRTLRFPTKRAMDFLGFDNGFREPPSRSTLNDGSPFDRERFAEGVRSEWNPAPTRALPNLGLGLTVGDQVGSPGFALGYVVSLTYSGARDYSEDRLFRYYLGAEEAQRGFVYQDYRNNVDWGGVANVSLRLGSSNKISLKNLYTRNAEELFSTSEGFNRDRNGDVRNYQMSYVERQLVQSQLAGEHLLRWLLNSRVEWKATLSQSSRNEPDNRQAEYTQGPDGRYGLNFNTDFWYRTLDDGQRSLQADWQIPTRLLWTPMTFKVGASVRRKDRKFDAYLGSFNIDRDSRPPADLAFLPPQQLFSPENLGTWVALGFPGASAQPYDADDDVTATYGLVDMNIASRVRLVAGARVENWFVDVIDGGRARAEQDTTRVPTSRRVRDILPSANLTVALSERMNLRLAAFQSVSRPDTRELSRDEYVEVSGSCGTIGNPQLQRGLIYNADSRVEWYPRPGEVLSVSGFYKYFKDPLLRTVDARNGCTYGYINGESANNFGAEFDLRKELTFLPGALQRLSVSANMTLVRSSVTIAPRFGTYPPGLDLEGQSPYLFNGSLSWSSEKGGVTATMLYNRFADRVVRYGFAQANDPQGPNIIEVGRGMLDAKAQIAVGRGATVSLAARNLTNARVQFVQAVDIGNDITGRAVPGVNFTLGVSLVR